MGAPGRGELSAIDLERLERAVVLGRAGWGRVHPNPMVGCLIAQGGEVVAEGHHAELGGPHAEVAALAVAGAQARGATVYVSLEPCAHHGRTPPCTRALIDAGVARVVYGASDPGRESGGGAEALAAAGIGVTGPVFSGARSRRENPAFYLDASGQGPWLALKLAVSLDGRLGRLGERTAVTGPEAAAWVHDLRRGFDAVMVGARTARIDDPLLTVRTPPGPLRQPARLVVDGRATLPGSASMLADGAAPVHVAVTAAASGPARAALARAGASVHEIAGTGAPDPEAVVGLCRELGFRSVLCEGGGVLGGALLSAGLVHRLYLVIAPRVIGVPGVPAFPEVAEGSTGAGAGPALEPFAPAEPPRALGRDTLIVLDREF